MQWFFDGTPFNPKFLKELKFPPNYVPLSAQACYCTFPNSLEFHFTVVSHTSVMDFFPSSLLPLNIYNRSLFSCDHHLVKPLFV